MSDEFWPEKPADIREFFSFYLAEGRGDFDSKKFGGLLRGLLPLTDEPERRKVQRLAAVGLLGNYLLNAFERESDHRSVLRGWTMIASYHAWFGVRSELPKKHWREGFDLSIKAAKESLRSLSNEWPGGRGPLRDASAMHQNTPALNQAASRFALVLPEFML